MECVIAAKPRKNEKRKTVTIQYSPRSLHRKFKRSEKAREKMERPNGNARRVGIREKQYSEVEGQGKNLSKYL